MKIEAVKKDEEHVFPCSYFGDFRGGCTRGVAKENGLYISFDTSDGNVQVCGFFVKESQLAEMGYIHVSKITVSEQAKTEEKELDDQTLNLL